MIVCCGILLGGDYFIRQHFAEDGPLVSTEDLADFDLIFPEDDYFSEEVTKFDSRSTTGNIQLASGAQVGNASVPSQNTMPAVQSATAGVVNSGYVQEQPTQQGSSKVADGQPAIRFGDRVEVIGRTGNITLTNRMRSVSDARVGEVVELEVPNSRKVMRARVIEPGRAMIVVSPSYNRQPKGYSLSSVRLGDISRLRGAGEINLRGIGLVVGLKGTGDGPRESRTQRALISALQNSQPGMQISQEALNPNNVAQVLINVTIPSFGAVRGQKVDVELKSLFGATSLAGGQLLSSALKISGSQDEPVAAYAAGGIVLNSQTATQARIPEGCALQRDFMVPVIDPQTQNRMTLSLNSKYQSIRSTGEIVKYLGQQIPSQAGQGTLSVWSKTPGEIQLLVPTESLQNPVQYLAHLFNIRIPIPQPEPSITIEAKTGVVVVTGAPEISAINYNSRQISMVVESRTVTAANSSVQTISAEGRPVAYAQDFLNLANVMHIAFEDKLDILKGLHGAEKLQAKFLVR